MCKLDELQKYGFYPIGGTIAGYIEESIRQLVSIGKDRYEIAEILGVSRSMVEAHANKLNIQLIKRKSGIKPKKLKDRTVEEFQQLLSSLTLEEICDEWDTNMVTLRKWRLEKGLTVERRGISR